ncbi:MAG: gamma-glutamylcyclotransferase family protein [Candidatus Saliniplasma sp.]
MSGEKVKYFAYGSNMNLEQMKERGTKVHDIQKAKLPGWTLDFTYKSVTREGGVLDIVPGDEDDMVQGVVYSIDRISLEKLDRFEGREIKDGREVGAYRRQFIPVRLDEDCKTVLTYVVNRIPEYKKDTHFPPSDDYMDTVIRGAREHGLDEDYIDMLESLRASERE